MSGGKLDAEQRAQIREIVREEMAAEAKRAAAIIAPALVKMAEDLDRVAALFDARLPIHERTHASKRYRTDG